MDPSDDHGFQLTEFLKDVRDAFPADAGHFAAAERLFDVTVVALAVEG